MKKIIGAVVISLAQVALCQVAFAGDGAVLNASALGDARDDLAAKVAQARARDPEIFTQVAAIEAYQPKAYLKTRSRRPYHVGLVYRRLGARALWALVDVALFHAPDRGNTSDADWAALRIGLLDAIGVQNEPSLAPLFRAAFLTDDLPGVNVAAAIALGRLGDANLAPLMEHARAGDARFVSAVRGLAASHRPVALGRLSDLLDGAGDEASASEVAAAIGEAASSWAWATGKLGSQEDAAQVSKIAAATLARNAARFHAEGAQRIGEATRRISTDR